MSGKEGVEAEWESCDVDGVVALDVWMHAASVGEGGGALVVGGGGDATAEGGEEDEGELGVVGCVLGW